MHVGILGSGEVAQALGTRNPAKLTEWHTTYTTARIGSFADAAASGEIV